MSENEKDNPEGAGQDANRSEKPKHRVLTEGEGFGNFRVVKCLCAGLIANYYHMQHIRDLHDVTVAIFHHRTANDQKFLKRLQFLQKTIKGFNHEKIPKIRDCTQIGDSICLFLDPVKGQSLSQYFQAHAIPGSRGLGVETTTRIMAQLLGILGYAHTKGLDHRDIDSDMIFVQEDGSLCLLGLGVKAALGTDLFESIVSASVSPLASSKTAGRLNSFDVMSPEYKGGITEDGRVDLYIAGVIGYWLLTAQKPHAQNLVLPTAYVDDLPLEWDAYLERMLERDREKRIQSCKLALLALKNTDDEPESERGNYVQRQIDRIPVPRGIRDRGELATRIYRLLFIGFFGVTSIALAAHFFTKVFTEEVEVVRDVARPLIDGESPDLIIEVNPPVAKIQLVGFDETYVVRDGLLELKVLSGSYTVKASAPERTPVTELVQLDKDGDEGPLRVRFDLASSWSELELRTEPGARVVIIDSRDIEIEFGRADQEGVFVLEEKLLSGAKQLILEKDGYSRVTFSSEALFFEEGATLDAPMDALPASLTVKTDPSGAQILLNEERLGMSPISVEDLVPNEEYLVVAQKEGYRAIGRRFKTAPGGEVMVDFGKLTPKSGEVRITATFQGLEPAESEALLEETVVVLNELRYRYGSEQLLAVPEGQYTIRLEHPDYVSEGLELSLADRAVETIRLTLSPRPASVRLVLDDSLQPTIRLNRREVELQRNRIAIPAFQAVEFELSIPNYLTMVRTFELRPNEEVVWEVNPVPIPGPKPGQDWTMPYINHSFSWIPAGSYTMGSPLEEEGRLPNEGDATRVRLTRGFWAGTFEVDQGAYREVMGKNPSDFSGARLPVDTVTWEEARAFCLLLTSSERKAGRLPEGYVFRLPTEAEWEYAARAGTETPFHFGEQADANSGNFRGVYPRDLDDGQRMSETYGTEPVGGYAPNAFGLHDVHGNVSEWTLDAYNGRLPGGSLVDPDPRMGGRRYTLRGGSWEDFAVRVRSAARVDARMDTESNAVGFRVFLAPEK